MNENCLRCLCCLKKIIFRKDIIVGKCYADFYDHIPFILLEKTENKLRVFVNGKLREGSYLPWGDDLSDYKFLEWELEK